MAKNNKIKELLIGRQYNNLTIISEPISKGGVKKRRYVKCRCVCGKETEPLLNSIMTGHTLSCGCINLIYKDRFKAKKIRESFSSMHQRCSGKGRNAKYYKDKGVYVCERWEKFENFYADMESTWELGLELDRYPNQKGIYEPDNCRWATEIQQQRNKSNVVFNEEKIIEIRSSDLNQEELAKKYNVNQSTISRIKNNKRWQLQKN